MKRLTAFLLCLALLASTLLVVSAAPVPQESALSDYEWDVLAYTNRERLSHGLEPLTSTPSLQRACDIRANEIVQLFDHARPNGTSCFTVLSEIGLPSYQTAGENIAAGQADPAAVVADWMNSPGHRANILDKDFVHMGVGYQSAPGARYGKYWVQLFYTGYSCHYTSMYLASSSQVDVSNQYIANARLTLALECSCGTSYLPLTDEFCKGYVPGKAGKQVLTVTVGGLTGQITINGSAAQFADVPANAWYVDAIGYATEHSLFNGTGANTFSPDAPMTRAMLVTVLHRYEGTPSLGTNGYSDVPNGQWYSNAVAWASAAGVVNGTGEGKFSPEVSLTREQLATILYRYCVHKSYTSDQRADLSRFPDGNKVSSYAATAMQWAVSAGLVNGNDVGGTVYLNPQGQATRAQVAAILMRFCENIAK